MGASSFLLSLVITGLVVLACRRLGLFDRLDARKIHHGDIPRLGGVGIFTASFIAIIMVLLVLPSSALSLTYYQLMAFLAGLIFFFGLGFLDDIYSLPAWLRFSIELLFALGITLSGVRIDYLFGVVALPPFISVPLSVIWIVGMVNAINFIDGLDGLAAGTSAIALFAIVVISTVRGDYFFALISLTLVAALLGFLPFNFYPAKVFLGDCGSMFLGFFVASISILGFFKQTALIVFLLPILLFFFPILDTTFAILRRLMSGQSPTKADRKHIHHRILLIFSRRTRSRAIRNGLQLNARTRALLQGQAHRNTVLILYAVTALLCAFAIFMGIRLP